MTTGVQANELRYLDPAVLSRIGSMELKARTVVEGFLTGLHRSPFKGFSVEFAEYRQYLPGDDIATIDWKVYARSDRHYVRKFEEETNLDCHLLLDISGSMGYASSGISKLEYGSYLAAALGYLMQRQRDAVGLITFDWRIVDRIPVSARPGHLRTLLLTLDRIRLGERSDLSTPLHALAEALTRRGMVVLISDLLDEPEQIIKGLKHLRYRGSDVVVFHILDHDELTFPFERATRFRDMETDDEVLAVPPVVRESYLKAVGDLIALYERELRIVGIDYRLVETTTPLDFALLSYLATRVKRY